MPQPPEFDGNAILAGGRQDAAGGVRSPVQQEELALVRRGAARRWTPVEGPLDACGGWFVRQHETPLMKAQFYDPYGVYPLNLAAHGLRLGDDNFWPSSGPLRTAVNQGQVSVIPAAEFAIISGD